MANNAPEDRQNEKRKTAEEILAEAVRKHAPTRKDPCIRAENEDDDGYDPYSDRRVYYTVNGEGEFYVNRAMIDKVIADVRRVQTGESVNPDTKY